MYRYGINCCTCIVGVHPGLIVRFMYPFLIHSILEDAKDLYKKFWDGEEGEGGVGGDWVGDWKNVQRTAVGDII